ncbi:unnamed protein product [Caenorhabditis nigoni]
MVVPESFQLDQEILLDAGAQLHRLKMYPYFDVAHYLLVSFLFDTKITTQMVTRTASIISVPVRDIKNVSTDKMFVIL